MTHSDINNDSILPDGQYDDSTIAVRAGSLRSPFNEHSEAIFTTSSFIFHSAEHAAKAFADNSADDFVYSRYTNPTVKMFEQRLRALEHADDAVAFSSGMAAIQATCLAFLQQGSRLVASQSLFGSSLSLLKNWMTKCGIVVEILPLSDLSAWEAALSQPADMVFIETPSNPLAEVVDIQALSVLCKSAGALLVVDNCFATPILQRPLGLGADLSLHSATKYIDGHGRALGGVVAGNEKLCAVLRNYLRTTGASLSPFNAWIMLKGLETLELRVKRSCETALAVAQWLDAQPEVAKVHYLGLPSHPFHSIAKLQMSGYTSVLAFEVGTSQADAWHLIDSVQWLSITANLGDNKTTIVHPATTTHGKLSQQERDDCHITANCIRLAVGLEGAEDIINELRRGLPC